MKRLFGCIGLVFLFLLFLTGCLSSRRVAWKSSVDSSKEYNECWNIVVGVVTARFPTVEDMDSESGYLQTKWLCTNRYLWECAEKSRAVVRVAQRHPFRVKIKVERAAEDMLKGWVVIGNHRRIESELMEEINSRLGFGSKK